ncbi:SCF ubiquitin ligase Skp1-like protein [Encephalitozoon hellem ATCC 50504]|uniref:E3 ubiquitin ligase complex SCF subunit n=1 Tax=Encephalitozoon hellem TaxID=27973 RepID=A0A9Q9C3B2_ENCHE|nr:SCF ubiquitin ligase Skp1-like protein [Encephalitozoon hellem ATCC 50504]AFM97917.1 SCF ubiquitin ligase Skp1-like protein [Encephalitozoon hellem ATCC 50504]UTX42720.1 suppressor of kinetochore protein 1 Skp1 [Encephalitozoon hellem]WEL38179.1 centromere-associated factor [Encephalitozoon hellem]|eukprot:XP_003886898.1 SCF ubiquitin ligase Skp1-like protein [Encephalitozoon hellem ATCC 50504]
MIEIETTDGRIFKIEEKQAYKSILIKNVCTSTVWENPITLQVSSPVFEIIRKYMEIDTSQLSEDYNPLEIRFKQSDFNFFVEYDNRTLLDICNGANYLEYPYLLELCCKIISEKMKHKNTRELAEFIGVDCNITDEELMKIEREFEWISSEE